MTPINNGGKKYCLKMSRLLRLSQFDEPIIRFPLYLGEYVQYFSKFGKLFLFIWAWFGSLFGRRTNLVSSTFHLFYHFHIHHTEKYYSQNSYLGPEEMPVDKVQFFMLFSMPVLLILRESAISNNLGSKFLVKIWQFLFFAFFPQNHFAIYRL